MRLDGWAICACVLVGCWDGTPANEPRGAGPSPLESRTSVDSVLGCAEGTEHDVALDDTTLAGFSAEDLLANIEGTHDDVIRWTTPDGLTVGPETGERTLRVSIERSGERARVFDPTQDVIGHGSSCQPWVIVEVIVTLQSEDGALNDRFTAELYAMDPRMAYLLAQSTELALAGDLSVTREEVEENVISETFAVAITLSEHGATGKLWAVWSSPMLGSSFIFDNLFQLAELGDTSCAAASYSLPLDAQVVVSDEVGATGQETVDSFNSTTSVTIDWASGASTKASVHFTPAHDGACVFIDVNFADGGQGLSVPGELELRSDDGRVDARWPGSLHPTAFSDDGKLTSTRFDTSGFPLSIDMPNLTPAELGFPFGSGGDTGVDTFRASYLVAFDDGVASGTIELIGYQDFNTVCDLPDDPECNFAAVPLETGTLR